MAAQVTAPAAPADDDDDDVALLQPNSNAEALRELALLRHSGSLDTLMGVDKFWSEKWFLLVLFLQDMALLWVYPIEWPYFFANRVRWILWTILEFDAVKIAGLPDCTDCDADPHNCALDGDGTCRPVSLHDSSLETYIYVGVVVGVFGLWTMLPYLEFRGVLRPWVSKNIERMVYPLLFTLHLPVSLKGYKALCHVETRVVEEWTCSPDLTGLIVALMSLLFVVGFPMMVTRRVALQSIYHSDMRRETYVRTRELEYMLKINTTYRDKRLWLQSSFTRTGRFYATLRMTQRVMFLMFMAGIRDGPKALGDALLMAGFLTFMVPAVLTSLDLVQVYRVQSSQWCMNLFQWLSAFNYLLGLITAYGGRLVDDDELDVIQTSVNYTGVGLFLAFLVFIYVVTHDFTVMIRVLGIREDIALLREREKTQLEKQQRWQSRYKKNVSEQNMKHLNLEQSMKPIMLDLCRDRMMVRKKITAAGQRGGAGSETGSTRSHGSRKSRHSGESSRRHTGAQVVRRYHGHMLRNRKAKGPGLSPKIMRSVSYAPCPAARELYDQHVEEVVLAMLVEAYDENEFVRDLVLLTESGDLGFSDVRVLSATPVQLLAADDGAAPRLVEGELSVPPTPSSSMDGNVFMHTATQLANIVPTPFSAAADDDIAGSRVVFSGKKVRVAVNVRSELNKVAVDEVYWRCSGHGEGGSGDLLIEALRVVSIEVEPQPRVNGDDPTHTPGSEMLRAATAASPPPLEATQDASGQVTTPPLPLALVWRHLRHVFVPVGGRRGQSMSDTTLLTTGHWGQTERRSTTDGLGLENILRAPGAEIPVSDREYRVSSQVVLRGDMDTEVRRCFEDVLDEKVVGLVLNGEPTKIGVQELIEACPSSKRGAVMHLTMSGTKGAGGASRTEPMGDTVAGFGTRQDGGATRANPWKLRGTDRVAFVFHPSPDDAASAAWGGSLGHADTPSSRPLSLNSAQSSALTETRRRARFEKDCMSELKMMEKLMALKQNEAIMGQGDTIKVASFDEELPFYVLPPSSTTIFLWPVNHIMVGQIKRENRTNRFIDVLADAMGVLMEVTHMSLTPELVRVPTLLFHVKRVKLCIEGCHKLRATHHMNALHPLYGSFEEVLENLLQEVTIYDGKSCAVGRRQLIIPMVSGYLYHRMNERRRVFALSSPLARRICLKLLCVRMFSELIATCAGRDEDEVPTPRSLLLDSQLPTPTHIHVQPPDPDAADLQYSDKDGGGSDADLLEASRNTQPMCAADAAPPPPGHAAEDEPPETEVEEPEEDPLLVKPMVIPQAGGSIPAQRLSCAGFDAAEFRRLSKRLSVTPDGGVLDMDMAAMDFILDESDAREDIKQAEAAARKALLGDKAPPPSENSPRSTQDTPRVTVAGATAAAAASPTLSPTSAAQLDTEESTARSALEKSEAVDFKAWAAVVEEAREQAARDEAFRLNAADLESDEESLRAELVQEAQLMLHRFDTLERDGRAAAAARADEREVEERARAAEDAARPATPQTPTESPQPPPPEPTTPDAPELPPAAATSSTPPIATPPPQSDAESTAKTPHSSKARRAELVATLNAWKAEYKEKHGKEPTKGVLMSDPSVADVYKEYTEMQEKSKDKKKEKKEKKEAKRGSKSADAGATPLQVEEDAPEAPPSQWEQLTIKALQKEVKRMAGELNTWKAAYKETHGKEPTKGQLRASDISETFEAYTEASTVLKRRKTAAASEAMNRLESM